MPESSLAPAGDIGMTTLKVRSDQFALPSGLKVAVEQAPTRGMVGVILTIGAGATSDPAGREGLAHLAEHLVFQARPAGGKGVTVAEGLTRIGAMYNAGTSLDTTRYHEVAPRAALAALLRTAAVRLGDPLAGVTEADLELERRVVMSELRQRNETGVYGQVVNWLQAALIPADHPYVRPLGGTAESLGRITLDDLRKFTREHYRPENATLVIVGEFTTDEAHALLKGGQFPADLRGDPERPVERRKAQVHRLPSTSPPPPPTGVWRHSAPVAFPEVWVGWMLPSYYGQQQGVNARLTSAPVLERELRNMLAELPIRSLDVIVLPQRFVTVLAVQVQLDDTGKAAEIAKVIRDLVGALWAPINPAAVQAQLDGIGVGDRGLRQAIVIDGAMRRHNQVLAMRQQALAHVVFDVEAYMPRAFLRADHLHFLGDAKAMETTLVRAAEVSPDELGQFATKYLAPERARTILIEPVPATLRPAPAQVGLAGRDREISDTPFAAARVGPPQWMPAPSELQSARRGRLPNGLEYVIVPRRQFEVVTVALGFRGGSAWGTPRGTVETVRLAEPPDAISMPLNAVDVHTVDGVDLTADVVRTGARNLSNALVLLALRISATEGLDWESILEKSDDGGRVPTPKISPQDEAWLRTLRALYGDHPYGRITYPSERRALTAEQLRAWFLRMRSPRNAVLVVAGDVDPDGAEKIITGLMSKWQDRPEVQLPSLPPVPPVSAKKETVIVTHRPGVSQVELTVACRLPVAELGSRAAVAHDMLAGVIGGYLSTRLRAETGAAYGVSGSAHTFSSGGAHLIITSAVDGGRLAEVLRSVRGHWRKFGTDGFDEGALSQVRWQQAINHNLGYQTSTELALRVLDTVGRKASLEHLSKYGEHGGAVAAADLSAAFKTCRDATVISLLGDEASIQAALQKSATP